MHGGRELVREEADAREGNETLNEVRHAGAGNGWSGGQGAQMKNAAREETRQEKTRAPKARRSSKNAARDSGGEEHEGHAELQSERAQAHAGHA
jgi:hypothetical protein